MTAPTPSSTPARGYSWPPFEKDNTAAVRHGAWSARKISPIAEELAVDLLEVAAADPGLVHLTRPIFRPAIRAWARVEARIELLSTWLDARTAGADPGDLTADGDIRPAADLLARLEGQALKHRAQLGIDPTSLARLQRDATTARSFDLAALLSAVDNQEPTDDEAP